MKLLIIIITLTFLLVPLQSNAQILDDQAKKELFQSLGFCQGQELHLKHIEAKFPNLEVLTLQARSEFGVYFGSSCNALNEFFPQKTKNEMLKHLKPILSKHLSTNTASAKRFLDGVKRRGKGQIDSPIKELLLAVNPTFVKSPQKEFLSGFKQSYNTKDHRKAKGMDLTIEFPASWQKREGKRPNIIQFFKSHQLSDNVPAFSILVKRFPKYQGRHLTNKEAQLLFSKELIVNFADGLKILESGSLTIEGQPAGYLVTDATTKRLGRTFTLRSIQYVLYYKSRIIFLSFAVNTSDKSQNIEDRLTRYRPLFELIANSLVINNKYQ